MTLYYHLMTLLNRLPIFPLYYEGNTKFMPIHCSTTDIIYHVISKILIQKLLSVLDLKHFLRDLIRLLKMIGKKDFITNAIDNG